MREKGSGVEERKAGVPAVMVAWRKVLWGGMV